MAKLLTSTKFINIENLGDMPALTCPKSDDFIELSYCGKCEFINQVQPRIVLCDYSGI